MTTSYPQKSITFIITEDRVVIRTSLGQTFYLSPKQHYWTRRVNLIRTMITLNEIRNLDELSSWCGHGVEWITTSRQYQLDNAEVLA